MAKDRNVITLDMRDIMDIDVLIDFLQDRKEKGDTKLLFYGSIDCYDDSQVDEVEIHTSKQ